MHLHRHELFAKRLPFIMRAGVIALVGIVHGHVHTPIGVGISALHSLAKITRGVSKYVSPLSVTCVGIVNCAPPADTKFRSPLAVLIRRVHIAGKRASGHINEVAPVYTRCERSSFPIRERDKHRTEVHDIAKVKREC